MIVITLENIYEQSHEPDAMGISKALSKASTLSALFHFDFVLPLVIKLSKCLQTEKLDLSIISSLVHATLHTIDEALFPAANWVLELMDAREKIERATGVKVTSANIASFQERVAKHTDLKNNIVCRFTSQDVVSSLANLILKKCLL